ncbi:MAG: YARHG domain-containing protein [Kofleriaceae bacterium]|nr:MAG: YARHG domain-containing protein [Kofleriaceae bacterium]
MMRALAGSIVVVVVVALIGACGGKKQEAGPGTGTGTGTGTETAAGGDERCAAPCRFLADTPIADVGAAYEKACGKPWVELADSDCDALDHMRNCIYAHHGYTFKKAKYQEAFGKEPWYKARGDFKESDLSRVASQNVRALKDEAATCRGEEPSPIPATFTASKVSKADLALVVGWFTRKAAGDPPLPKKLEADGNPATEADIKGWLAQKQLFTLEAWTPIEYEDGKRTGHRKITAATGAPSPDCYSEDEDCEGFEWITFEIDEKNQIIGLSVGAAACPLVYVEGEDGALTYEGEILRDLVRAGREATQHLRLDAAGACHGEVRVQLVEAKDEITYLDDVALVVDGVAIAPRACANGATPAYCANDGRYLTLHRGDSLPLVFDVPAGAACATPELRADGYYVPLAPTYTQR